MASLIELASCWATMNNGEAETNKKTDKTNRMSLKQSTVRTMRQDLFFAYFVIDLENFCPKDLCPDMMGRVTGLFPVLEVCTQYVCRTRTRFSHASLTVVSKP